MSIVDDAIDWAISQGLPTKRPVKTFDDLTFTMPTLSPDWGYLTEGDVEMIRRAITAGAEDVDFSEFYLDDEDE